MTEKEFLKRISYSVNEHKQEMEVWYNQQVLGTLSFLEYPEKLQDDYYCTELSYEVALQSSLAEKLIKDNLIYLKQLKSGNWKKSDLWNYDIVLEVDELEEWWKKKTGKVIKATYRLSQTYYKDHKEFITKNKLK